MIILSSRVTATTADLLNSTRLQSVPYNGMMSIMLLADAADATNNFTATVQLPNGDTPVDTVMVPGSNPALAGVLDSDQWLKFSFPIAQGGHVVITLTETGTAICSYRIRFGR